MGLIGRFIDTACERRPDLMRAVRYRPFGSLEDVMSVDDAGNRCGCLVGTIAIVAERNGSLPTARPMRVATENSG